MKNTEKYKETVKLLGQEVADRIFERNQKIEYAIISKFGKKLKYKVRELQTNESIREGKEMAFYRIETVKGEFDIEI